MHYRSRMVKKSPKTCLADNLEFLIEERGVSGNWIAREAGLSNKTVANWRNQVGEPTAGDVAKVARVFGVEVWQLFHPDIRETLPHGSRLLSAYYRSTPEGRAFIDQITQTKTDPDS